MSSKERSEEPNIDLFAEIDVRKPSDKIIEQIQKLIGEGKLKPGMKLPSERDLAQRFGVGRGHIREALKKLEFYGIIRTQPQSGSVVAELGEKAIQGLIGTLLRFGQHDLSSLFETRALLEIHSARMASERATPEDLETLRSAHADFCRRIDEGHLALEEDHVWHLTVARCAKNPVLASLIGLLTPEIMQLNRDSSNRELPTGKERLNTKREHTEVFEAILERDPEGAASAMRNHMEQLQKRRLGKSSRERRSSE